MTSFQTLTGNYPIGFRRGGWAWQREISTAVDWAKSNGFGALDLSRNPDDIAPVLAGGLRVGSVDLLEWQGLISADAAKRAESVDRNNRYIAQCGAQNYFAVMIPADQSLPRKENLDYMFDSLNKIAPELEAAGGKLVIEGWPGAGSLVCTPETFRATFAACPSSSIGINYDPSHLLRMGIEPIKFLKEFVSRVGHVHGKDTELLAADLYEYGHELPAAYKPDPFCGSSAWRYTIPGHGSTPWKEVFRILQDNKYAGAVSIELEDKNYNGTTEGEQLGLISGAKFLASC
jgi:sugar phosphate isomerase/epimerase